MFIYVCAYAHTNIMKISIVYFSESGNTEKAAGFVAEGARSVPGTEVRCFNLKNPDTWDASFINESSAVIFGTPTYYGNMCWQLKKWFDTDRSVKLGGKLGGVFATENSPNGGGAELAIMTTINHMLVCGMMAYSSGGSCGLPYIHVGPAIVKDVIDSKKEICGIFGRRMAEKATELFGKK